MGTRLGSKWWLHMLSLAGAGAVCLSSTAVLQAATDPSKPNFLFIQADQFRYDLLRSVQDEMPRYAGKTKVRTPNLDRLRSEGVYFSQAYAQCAVCGPSRATFRTGNTIERHGQQSNELYKEVTYKLSTQFKNKIEANVTFEQILADKRGYTIEHFGKWHMPRIFNFATNKVTQMMRYNDAKFTAMTHSTDYGNIIYSFYNGDDTSYRYDNRLAEVAGGLSTVESSGMQEETYSHFPYVTDAIDVRYGLPPYTVNNPLTGLPAGQTDQQGRSTLPATRTSSYFEGTSAIGALDRLARGTQPFSLTASFHNPHAPMVATGVYYDYYKALEANMLIPPSLSGADLANSSWLKHTDPDYQNSAKVKEWMVSYYALCEEVDTYVGTLLAKLDQYGIANNTMVIFVSDHGEALGAHGMREKNTFLEESAHVPMLMRFPGKIAAGTEVNEPVATLDCVATILDYVGASSYYNGDGRSLRRFIEKANYNKDFDDEAIVTEWDFRTPTNSVGKMDRSLGGEINFLCKKGPWKLMITKKASSTKKDMLYNIETDPYEIYNYLGTNGMAASDAVIGKTEHLKCLLMEWMQRMDGGTKKYYSDPVWNAGEGLGDIAEIKARRKWKTANIWVSDTAIQVGRPVSVSGQLTRNEYIYLGRTTSGTLTVSSITLQGADAGLFQLSGFTSGTITQGNYGKVKLTYRPPSASQTVQDARIVISHSAGAAKVIELSAVSGGTANLAPYFTSDPFAKPDAAVGVAYDEPFSGKATDPEGGTMTFSKVSGPAWLSVTTAGNAQGTPASVDAGTNSFLVKVTDASGLSDTATMTINVTGGSSGSQTVTFTSVAAEDGYVNESTETSNIGGTLNVTNSAGAGLRVGDMSDKKQVKTVVSFDTSSLPDGAVIQSATLKLMRGAISGTVTNLGVIKVDIKGGTGFNSATALTKEDFEAAADAANVATMSYPTANGTLSTGSLSATGLTKVNKTGKTQLRVYFATDDDNDATSDYLGFYPAENATAANRPVLEVTYQ